MVVIRTLLWNQLLQRIRTAISWKMTQASLTFRSLTYNEHMTYNYFVDCMLEPLIWFVDNYSKCLGKVFVFCVSILTTAVVAIAYWVGLPYWWERSPLTTIALVIFGNWLLMNIIFHYYMGVVTSPGYPPDASIIPQAAGICKKCITPKPARTHHCSVCDRCILAMDHHCPWLNNCVGYYNARYFYLYMIYMLAGVTFVILAGFNIGYVALWLNDNGGLTSQGDPDLIGHPVKMNKSGVYVPVKGIPEYDIDNQPREHNLPTPTVTEAQRITANVWKRRAVLFTAVTCIAVLIALGVLARMHAKNISQGETSIESHVNTKMRLKGKFRNPYDFGRGKNWRLFLGLTNGRTFWRHVLLPSAHRPCGDGVTWHTVDGLRGDWP